MLIQRVPWEIALKNQGVQEGWTYLKKETLRAQEQAVPMGQKMSEFEHKGKQLLPHLYCRQLELPQIWYLLITLKSKVEGGKAEEDF